MRVELAKLPTHLLQFLEAHERFAATETRPTDRELAKRLGVTRDTIIHRRNRIRYFGIDLPPLGPRGFRKASNSQQLDLFN